MLQTYNHPFLFYLFFQRKGLNITKRTECCKINKKFFCIFLTASMSN
ncbi:hypothetical protein DCCM_0517 [Desulfocucumis palustris]|uniref:Uncharacterized protein n=1 Tax=Desulfocucumis palustris TaxID=1898651 RepID=A0A2L2X9P6_9FIRM|nr:hypothetical protein DCCM_0517 [Desulfocucumis palustris]